jgi:hypothetical protein
MNKQLMVALVAGGILLAFQGSASAQVGSTSFAFPDVQYPAYGAPGGRPYYDYYADRPNYDYYAGRLVRHQHYR